MAQTVVVDVSSHGFGHVGQIAPVLEGLVSTFPSIHVVIRSAHPGYVVREFVECAVKLDEPPPEAMLVSQDPTTIDTAATVAAYRDLHRKWDEHLDRATARLAGLAAQALVADVPYLSLAAAKRLGIPSIAIGSLNWLDLYRTYCAPAQNDPIIRAMKDAYQSAKVFLQPQPHMLMSDLRNQRSIGPIARTGRRRASDLHKLLGLTRKERVVLVTFGGIRSQQPLRLPSISGVHWLVGSNQAVLADRATHVCQINMKFIDQLASCDAVVTKVGYCTFVEAACNGVGLVSANRTDWPESAGLIAWAQENASFALVEAGIESERGLRIALSAVLDVPRKMPVTPLGILEAVEVIADIAGLRQSTTES